MKTETIISTQSLYKVDYELPIRLYYSYRKDRNSEQFVGKRKRTRLRRIFLIIFFFLKFDDRSMVIRLKSYQRY